MSQLYGQGTGGPTKTGERSWEKPAAADDIVDPIGVGPSRGALADDTAHLASDEDQSDEDQKDVPLEVQFTDALSMLADGGHDYRSTPLATERPLDEDEMVEDDNRFEAVEIDESSKDA